MKRRYRNRRQLARYLTGATSARTGDEMSGPALLLLGLATTGSVETASALLAGLTMSAAFGGPVLGALLDRSSRPGTLLAVVLTCHAAGLAGILLAAGHAPAPVVVGMAVLTGTLNSALSGGWTAQLPRIAPDTVPRAIGLDAMTFDAASLAGPALTGLLARAFGASAPMILAVVLVAAAAPVAWTLPRHLPAQPRRRHSRAGQSIRRRALHRALPAALRAVTASRSLARATATSVVSFIGVGMLVVCCPLIALHRFGDPGTGVLLLAVSAAAGMLANALLTWLPNPLRPDTIVLASTLLIGSGLCVAAVSATAGTTAAGLVVVAVVAVGFGEGPQLTGLFAVRHREAPAHLRAQIFTTGASLKITGFAAGSALAGPLAAWSLPGCLLIAAGIEGLAALVYAGCSRPSIRTPSPARVA